MPHTLIQACELHLLLDQGNRYAAALAAAGVAVGHVAVPGVDHGHTLRAPVEPALASFELMATQVSIAVNSMVHL
jgi:acetyl esterase/lipase